MQANFTDNSFLKITGCDLDEAEILKDLCIEEIKNQHNINSNINLMKFTRYYDGVISFWWSSFEDPHNHILCGQSDLDKRFYNALKELRRKNYIKLGIIKTKEVTMGGVRLFPYWADELDIPDDRSVIVYDDGSVTDLKTGEIFCESFSPQASISMVRLWSEYWGF